MQPKSLLTGAVNYLSSQKWHYSTDLSRLKELEGLRYEEQLEFNPSFSQCKKLITLNLGVKDTHVKLQIAKI
jgi:hypothetical protein